MKIKQTLKVTFYYFLVILTTSYLTFRIFYTLPLNLGILALTAGILVLLLEIWEAFDFFIHFLNILIVEEKSPKTPSITNSSFPDVDILIATYNEEEDLLRNTIIACKNLEYPDKNRLHICICDDGDRKNIKNLASSLGINYISRNNRRNAKAGNYNHALNRLTSPYVATFDADMCPSPDFLLSTIPFFLKENNIGFVQLPQSFMNPDIFQYRFGLSKRIPFEQDYFYHHLQTAKNATNTPVCCGTNTVFSRKALDSINGFVTSSLSEDIATGMLIENAGYKCIALDEIKAYGYSVNDLDGFLKQRSRWARGCVQMLKRFKIITCKGLSIRQKLEYLSCVSYWFFGVRRMLYLLIPILFAVFNVIVVDCDLTLFIGFWLPTYLLKRFALDRFANNKRSSTWNKIYETILAPILSIEVLKEFFGFKKTTFDVSPKKIKTKKMSKTNFKLLLSHSLLLLVNILGLTMCLVRLQAGAAYTFILPLVWLVSNIFYLSTSIIFDINTNPKEANEFVPNKIQRYSKKAILLMFFNIDNLSKKAKTTK